MGAWDEHRAREKERAEREKAAAKIMNGTKSQLRENMMESVTQRLAEFKRKSMAGVMVQEDKPPPLGLVAGGLVPPPLGMVPRPPAAFPGVPPALGRPPGAPAMPQAPPIFAAPPQQDSPPKPTPLDLGKRSSFGIKLALAPAPSLAPRVAPQARASLRAPGKPAVFAEESDDEEEIPSEARYE